MAQIDTFDPKPMLAKYAGKPLPNTLRTERRTGAAFEGAPHALARRMGVMYVIWNDHMYAAWDQFAAEDYLSGGCRTLTRCSATLRHRDHVHISLSTTGAKGQTSWYLERLG